MTATREPLRCPGCRELLDATHRPGCPQGTGAVLRKHVEQLAMVVGR